MKKPIVKLFFRAAVFVLIFIGLLLWSSDIFAPKDNTESSGMDAVDANGILGEQPNQIDVLFVGDSESYTAFSPMHMWNLCGFTSYVCGTSAQPLYDSMRFVRQAFESQNPRVVVLETNAVFRSKSAGSHVLSLAQSYFSLFRYHDRWKSMSYRDLYKPVSYTWNNPFKGYRYSAEIQGTENKEYMVQTLDTEPIPELNLLYLKQMQMFCAERNSELIFVSTPSSANWNYARHNAIEQYAEDNGIRYLDMNLCRSEVGIDWTVDTQDLGDHLNHTGAKKASAYTAQYLTGNFQLPDHRDEKSYDAWNEAYRRYCLTVSDY